MSAEGDDATKRCFALLFAHLGAKLFEQQDFARAETAFRNSLIIDPVRNKKSQHRN